jgi:Ras-related GTP-binding protein A/B
MRFEKMSNIIKQFKLSCSKSQSQLLTMEIRNSNASIFIRPLTGNTFIMVVMTNTRIQSALAIMNIEAVKDKFVEIEKAAA